MKTNLTVATYDRSPRLFAERDRLVHEAFPEFAMHSAIIDEYIETLDDDYPEYQFGLHDNGKLIAIGNCMPVAFDGPLTDLPHGGVEWGLQNAAELASGKNTPSVLCAFQIVIDHAARNRGVSYQAIEAMVNIARTHNLKALIAPVRPNRKEDHPLMPMDEYVAMKRDDGLPYDDWLRVHVRLRADVLHVCKRSFVIEGTIAEWEQWTGQKFKSSGDHIVKGALNPVSFDIEKDHGIYVEPNVWVVHRI